MQDRGYKVHGIGGHKALGGCYPIFPIFPKMLRYIINDLFKIVIKNNIKKSFELICIKET